MRRGMGLTGKTASRLMVALALACGAAAAQAPPPPPHGFGPSPDAIGVQGFAAGFNDKVVTGTPYSATISTQTSQTLPDGNQIQRTTTGTVARDSQGRTRREMTLKSIGPWAASGGNAAPHFVLINDVVAGASYAVQPELKTAQELPQRLGRKNRNGAREDRNNVVSTPLGSQTISGVVAEGTRYTRTIPAGAIGNEKPIVITTERWYSSDLQTVVMTKRSDPRTGETVFTLSNIQRTEPDASLFQVPSNFTVTQGGPGRGQGRSLSQSPVQ
jgi:hypothetical protein